LYLEEGDRFLREDIRPDLGNNGFCVLEIRDGSVDLSYRDWMGNIRCEVVFSIKGRRLAPMSAPVLPKQGSSLL
jgi:hypothetical protein